MCIIAKDLTVQQRDQNKKRRAEKIKQQKALKEKKTVDNENNPENIDQEMIVDVIAGSQEFMDDTAPPSQSQQPLIPLLFDNLHAHNIDVNEDNLSLSSLGEETIIGGFDLEKSRRPQAHGPGTTTNNEYESSFIFNFSSTVNSEHLKVMHTNVDSFMNKRDELRALIRIKVMMF